MRHVTLAFLFLVGCGGSSLKNQGDECVATSECAAGLVCDLQMNPPVCVPEGTGQPPDADPSVPDSNPLIPDANPLIPDAEPAPPDAEPSGTQLTVKNYLAWCDVSVNGGTASPAAQQVVTVDPGVIPLSAVALNGFQLGTTPWHNTDGDTGGGEQGTITGSGQTASSATTETVGATADCVWVCCEFTGGGGCPTTDQCP